MTAIPFSLPTQGHRATLILSIALVILTLTLHQPLKAWVILMMLCSATIRIYIFRVGQTQRLSSRLINLLAILACISLAWSSRQQGLLEIMVNLLITGCALKLLSLRQRRDFLQLAACALFLVGCALIFHQSMAITLMLSMVLLLIMLSLQQLYAPQLAFKKQLSAILRMGLQALPVACLLFVVIPRLPPLWGMPAGKSTQTGLSDTMTPGDIAKLTQSSERVFTATFDLSVPPPTERYWRAMVLEQFDGKTWQLSPYRKQQQMLQSYGISRLPVVSQSTGTAYQLMVEPSSQRWLYSLNVTGPGNDSTRAKTQFNDDFSVSARQPVMSKQAFALVSDLKAPRPLAASGIDSKINLQLPAANNNERTRRWAAQLRARYSSDDELADAIMTYFANQGFSYTLTPPAMPANPVDAFLFDNQTGFCAHYASAMAYVLRLVGIPARVVSGYQGGEKLTDNVVSIFQYDAHAWVEAAVDGKTWQRFDPTAMVALSRLQYGFQQSMADQHPDLPLFSRAGAHDSVLLSSMFSMVDTINYQWSRWVLGFDSDQQDTLFKNMLGKKTTTTLALFGLVILLFITGLLALYFVPRPAQKHADEPQRLFDSLALQLQKLTGIERAHLSARQYLRSLQPVLDKDAFLLFAKFVDTFETIRYLPGKADRKKRTLLRNQHDALRKYLKYRGKGLSVSSTTSA